MGKKKSACSVRNDVQGGAKRFADSGGLLRPGAGRAGEVALIEALAEQGFDDGLAADIQLFGEAVQFMEHGCGEIRVDALDGLRMTSG